MNEYKKITIFDQEGTLEELEKLVPWLRKASFENAKVSITKDDTYLHHAKLNWHDGTWHNGTWHQGVWQYGTWLNGRWRNGQWHNGTWFGGEWEMGWWHNGKWMNGEWFGGIWQNGQHIDGVWYKGSWFAGEWFNGEWEKGEWVDGEWQNGTWDNGTWYNGSWYNGIWENGTWEDGIWHDGEWRAGTWKKGQWLSKFPRGRRKKFNRSQHQNFAIDRIKKINIGKIKNITLYELAHELSKLTTDVIYKFTIKVIKQQTKTNFKLSQLISKKDGQAFIKNFPNGFSINDIVNYDQRNKESVNYINEKFGILLSNKNIEVNYSQWNSREQTYLPLPNKVFQVNFNEKVSEYLTDRIEVFEKYKTHSNHPTSKKLLTLGWVRYTVMKKVDVEGAQLLLSGVLIDEIQSDLPALLKANYKNEDLNDELVLAALEHWDEFIMRLFIKFVRQTLRQKKIYLPTYQSKIDLYDSNPPMYLYKELPNKFGFKKDKNWEGFMILEQKKLNLAFLMENITHKYESYWIKENGKVENVSNFPDTHVGYVRKIIKGWKEDDSIYLAMRKGWIKMSSFMKDITVEFLLETVTDKALKSLVVFLSEKQNIIANVYLSVYKNNLFLTKPEKYDIQYIIDNLYKIIDNVKNPKRKSIRDVSR